MIIDYNYICQEVQKGGFLMEEYGREEVIEEMNERERQDTKMATLYEIRLTVSQSDKENYTKEEILQMLDTIAMTKVQK